MPAALSLGSEEMVLQQQKKRQEILFQIERLLLRAKPYDSIGFFHVQRELIKYLELGEIQDSATSTHI